MMMIILPVRWDVPRVQRILAFMLSVEERRGQDSQIVPLTIEMYSARHLPHVLNVRNTHKEAIVLIL